MIERPGQRIIDRANAYGPLITVMGGVVVGTGIGFYSIIDLYAPRHNLSHNFPLLLDHVGINLHLALPIFAAIIFLADEASTFFFTSQIARAKRLGLTTWHGEASVLHPNVETSEQYFKSWRKNWKKGAALHGGFILGSALFPPIGLGYGISKLAAVGNNIALGSRYARAVLAEQS